MSLLMGVSVCTGKLRNSRWLRQVPVKPTVWFPAWVSGHQAWVPGPSVIGQVITRLGPGSQDAGPSGALGSQPLRCCPDCSHAS